MKIPKSRAGLALGFAVCLLVTGVISAAAHPGGPKKGVIHSCVDDATGAVVIADRNDTCGRGESPLDWNAEGRRGPRGAIGLQGPQGLQGPPGPPGQQGPSGILGFYVLTSGTSQAPGAVFPLEAGVDCLGSDPAVGGGFYTDNGDGSALRVSAPLELNGTDDSDPAAGFPESGDTPTGWYVRDATEVGSITVFVVCADLA